MKLKRKIKIKLSNMLVMVIILIIILSFYILQYVSKNISTKVIDIAGIKINELNNDIIMDAFNEEILNTYDLNDLIIITKNKNDEILTIDFNMKNTYLVSMDISKNIKSAIDKKEDNTIKKYQDDGYILFFPMGIASRNSLFSSLGPEIIVKVKYANNLSTGLKTKVKSYGINNVLVEVYMKIELTDEIIIPYKKKITNKQEILLTSKIISGVVPEIYNGLLDSSSSLINVPLND